MQRNYIWLLILSALVTSKSSALFPEELPHLAHWGKANGDKDDKPCIASLIGNRHLLTQASCIMDSEGPFEAHLGGLDRKKTVAASILYLHIKQKIPHPNFNKSERYNDIAILVLQDPIEFTKYIKSACIQEDDNITETEAIATRWGLDPNTKSSKYLSEVTLPLNSMDDCKKIEELHSYPKELKPLIPNNINETTMFCAGGRNDEADYCEGRSGGPLQIKKVKENCTYTIIGIPTLRDECVSKMGIYTKVSSYYEWIKSYLSEPAPPTELPHYARWWKVNGFKDGKPCVASLISNQHLLTQASCYVDFKGLFMAKLGGLDHKKIYRIEKKTNHPGFRSPERYNDIAILVLQDPINFTTYIQPACFEKDDNIIETEAIATRKSKVKNSEGNNYLSKVTLPLLNMNECKEKERKFKSVLPKGINKTTMLCAGKKNVVKDNCDDQPGGPLQIKDELKDCEYSIIGIPILEDKCASKAGLYTKVSSYYEWINSEIGQKTKIERKRMALIKRNRNFLP